MSDPNPYDPSRPLSARYYRLLAERKALPVWSHASAFLDMFARHAIVLLVGETGSGKTTQIPQMMLGALPGGRVAVTQPRRVAATSVARRVAEEMDVRLGELVGYSVRFDDCSGPATRLKYLTDGMLIRDLVADPALSAYDAVVLDEAHERTAATDVLMGILKDAVRAPAHGRSAPLKLVVMSATLDVSAFCAYFAGAPLLRIPGRLFSVEVLYTPEEVRDAVAAAVTTVIQIHTNEALGGDILAFLPGEREIEAACEQTKAWAAAVGEASSPLWVLPLYGILNPAQQQRVFDPTPAGARKAIFATNIAETSLTIEGVVYVVDAGLVKQKIYSPRNCAESLVAEPISKAAAQQRAGRAGRTRSGKAFRLYTAAAFQAFHAHAPPEILRSNLAPVVLQLRQLGVVDLVHFDFMDPPPPELLMRALELLHLLGFLDDDGNLTPAGHQAAVLPLDPQLTRVIQAAAAAGATAEAILLAAALSVPSLVVPGNRTHAQKIAATERATLAEHASEHLSLVRLLWEYGQVARDVQTPQALRAWCNVYGLNARNMAQALAVRDQLENLAARLGLHPLDSAWGRPDYPERLLKALLAGYFTHLAFRVKINEFLTTKDDLPAKDRPGRFGIQLSHETRWVVYHEMIVTQWETIAGLSPVRIEWLAEVAPHYLDLLPDLRIRKHIRACLRGGA